VLLLGRKVTGMSSVRSLELVSQSVSSPSKATECLSVLLLGLKTSVLSFVSDLKPKTAGKPSKE
jgi:hypothetical protein